MWFPNNIDAFALPYLFLGGILSWTGLLFLVFFYYLAKGPMDRAEFLFFALLSIFFGVFSFASGIIYGTESSQIALNWSKIKLFSAVMTATLITPFAAATLKIYHSYLTRVLPFLGLISLLVFFKPDWFITSKIFIHHAVLWGFSISQAHIILTPVSHILISFGIINLIVILIIGMIKKQKNVLSWIILFAFVLVAIHEALLSFGVYQSLSLVSFAFSAFLILMAIKLFLNVITTNRAIAKTSQQLQKTNEEMQFLVSTISHDTISPLISIRGFIDLLKENFQENSYPDPSKVTHFLKRIRININHVKSLLGSLVSFASIGRVEEKTETLDLKKTFQEAIDLLNLSHHHPGVTITFEGDWPKITGSAQQYKQVMTNLITNAIRHAKHSDVKIHLSGKITNKGFTFSIEDNGPGIPTKHHSKIFDTFFRHDPNAGGAGLGLAIVKKIVTNQGGHIKIDSQFTEGTRFDIFLPLTNNHA